MSRKMREEALQHKRIVLRREMTIIVERDTDPGRHLEHFDEYLENMGEASIPGHENIVVVAASSTPEVFQATMDDIIEYQKEVENRSDIPKKYPALELLVQKWAGRFYSCRKCPRTGIFLLFTRAHKEGTWSKTAPAKTRATKRREGKTYYVRSKDRSGRASIPPGIYFTQEHSVFAIIDKYHDTKERYVRGLMIVETGGTLWPLENFGWKIYELLHQSTRSALCAYVDASQLI